MNELPCAGNDFRQLNLRPRFPFLDVIAQKPGNLLLKKPIILAGWTHLSGRKEIFRIKKQVGKGERCYPHGSTTSIFTDK